MVSRPVLVVWQLTFFHLLILSVLYVVVKHLRPLRVGLRIFLHDVIEQIVGVIHGDWLGVQVRADVRRDLLVAERKREATATRALGRWASGLVWVERWELLLDDGLDLVLVLLLV